MPPPGQIRLVGADASHAWVGVFVPGFGWVDLDPTNGLVQPDRHVTVGWGRDYTDVVPVRGVVFGPPAEQHLTGVGRRRPGLKLRGRADTGVRPSPRVGIRRRSTGLAAAGRQRRD